MKQVKRKKIAPPDRNEIREQTGKRRRRRKKRKYTLYYILFTIILLSVGFVLCSTVFFRITDFVVEDPGVYTASEIVLSSKIEMGENLIRSNMGQAEESILNSCFYLDAVDVSRKFPSSVKISCVPAEIAYNLQQPDGSYDYISNGGRVLEVSQPEPVPDAVILIGMEMDRTLLQGEFLDLSASNISVQLEQVQSAIASAGLSDITSIQIIGDNSAVVVYQGRIKIRVDDLSQAEYLMRAAQKIISEYIGTSEHGTLFFDPASQSVHFLPDSAF